MVAPGCARPNTPRSDPKDIGAMASTATLPWHDDFTVVHAVRDPLPVTGTYIQTPGALRGGGYSLIQSGTGWVFTYARIPLRAGTYTRRYVARTDSNSGIVTFTIGGISAGTADGYSVGNVNDVVFDAQPREHARVLRGTVRRVTRPWAGLALTDEELATGIVIPSDGFYDLVLTSTTKNASSAGYRANAQLTRLFRTGA